MIVHDKPRLWKEAFAKSAHLCSTLVGGDGHDELVAFGRKIGLKPEWLKDSGHVYHEHFSIFGTKLEAAAAAGATELTDREFAAMVQRKFAEWQCLSL